MRTAELEFLADELRGMARTLAVLEQSEKVAVVAHAFGRVGIYLLPALEQLAAAIGERDTEAALLRPKARAS